MLQGLIDRETDAPAYIAARRSYRAYLERQQQVEARRSRLVAVDDPAYLLRQAKDSS